MAINAQRQNASAGEQTLSRAPACARRPRRGPPVVHTDTITIRLSARLAEAIETGAATSGKTKSAWLRDTVSQIVDVRDGGGRISDA